MWLVALCLLGGHAHANDEGADNQPPIVAAGSDQALVSPVPSATLAGSATDEDGEIVEVSWTQVSGPPTAIQNADETTALVTGPLTLGDYRFRLTAVDDMGASASDEVVVHIVEVNGSLVISGTPRTWHTVTLSFFGEWLDEAGPLNPFRNRRLDVTFTHDATGLSLRVPGFFAADGAAADTGASSGPVWKAHFAATREGLWRYAVSFRGGPNVAATLAANAGTPVAFDGITGTLLIEPADESAPGFRGKGRIVQDGHYLVHAETWLPYFKGGANSPENLLAYADFDQTEPSHLFAPHTDDWELGDPTWSPQQRGRALIGALNYLAGQGMNAVYALSFNVGGDGDDVWPWISKTERLRFDVSKLEQWERVFTHMDNLGLMLHVVTQETENDNGPQGLDAGELGLERSLYYRELVARFGHHLGVTWNLGEETSNTTAQLLDFHTRLRALDPYKHPVVAHTFPDLKDEVYAPLLAAGAMQGASLQVLDTVDVHAETLQWRLASAASGVPWPIHVDEIGPPGLGAVPDIVDPGHDVLRRDVLWPSLLAGGVGVEWYFGHAYPNGDIDCEDWRTREELWTLTRHALTFFDQLQGVTQMFSADQLVNAPGAHCLARPGVRYLLQLPTGGTSLLNLGNQPWMHSVRWYDPRAGGALQRGSVEYLAGPGWRGVGQPPSDPSEDWIVLVERTAPADLLELHDVP